jgi:hypothetical protein
MKKMNKLRNKNICRKKMFFIMKNKVKKRKFPMNLVQEKRVKNKIKKNNKKRKINLIKKN